MADSWRYGQVSFKASHNSYDRDEMPITDQLTWSAQHPHQAGCRGLEVDIVEAPNLWLWSVQHGGGDQGAADMQFVEYLRHLRHWSEFHPNHDVITITVDLKSKSKDSRQFPRYFDLVVNECLGAERLYTPRQLLGSHSNLVAAAMSDGWPTLSELRGKFILCLSGEDEVTKRGYARGRRRLSFVDQRFRSRDAYPSTTVGDRVFFNFDTSESWAWDRRLRWFATQRGLITRAYVLNEENVWNKVRAAEANILATDKVRNQSWAKIGSQPFRNHRSALRANQTPPPSAPAST